MVQSTEGQIEKSPNKSLEPIANAPAQLYVKMYINLNGTIANDKI